MAHRIDIVSKIRKDQAVSFIIDADLSEEELRRCTSLLINPIIETTELPSNYSYAIDVSFLPGVTDNAGNTSTEILGYKTYSSKVFFVQSKDSYKDLYNPLIQSVKIKKFGEPLDVVVPKVVLPKASDTQEINLNVSDDELIKISFEKTLALDLTSMRAIQSYFKKIKRNPTDIELESLAQTWSEHCKHTIFADPIDGIKDGLYKHYIKGATNKLKSKKPRIKKFLASVFSDNSGAIVFDKDYLMTHKVETHNTPSALDPFGGAITGIVGVNRDTIGFGLGAKPIANFYGFCLADPKNRTVLYRDEAKTQPMLSARRIMDGVIEGINAGGNQSGIPTPQGFLYFNDRYRGKPLVFAGTVGIIPRRIKGKLSHIKSAKNGDYIVMLGGRVGRDGIHGATFSSETLSPDSPATAVQIGDPITQKKFSDAIVKEARDMGLYHSITDNGAGGLSSSVGEMAKDTNGCEVELSKVPLKYPGLEPWQVWISESQERMTLAVPPKNWEKLQKLMKSRDVEVTILGKFTKSGRCVVKNNGKVIMDISMDFLHNGRPAKAQKTKKPKLGKIKNISISSKSDLVKFLTSPNSTSTEFLARQYDHTVQGTAVVGPLQGKGRVNGNASVIAPVLGSKRGIVMSYALEPELTEVDPYRMATTVIERAICNAVAIGANPENLAILDNFCWCSSNDPERLWQLKEAVRGCYDSAILHEAPFISGKDSMFNDFKGFDSNGNAIKISVPPTLLISAVSVIPDVTKTVTEDFKASGDLIYYVENNVKMHKIFYKIIQKNILASSISIQRGGIAEAIAKSSIAGLLGCSTSLGSLISQSGIIASVDPKNKKRFERMMHGDGFKLLGEVTDDEIINIKGKSINIKISVKEAYDSYHDTFKNY